MRRGQAGVGVPTGVDRIGHFGHDAGHARVAFQAGARLQGLRQRDALLLQLYPQPCQLHRQTQRRLSFVN